MGNDDAASAPRGAREVSRRLAVAALVCATAVAALYVVAVLTRTGQQVDEAVVRGAEQLLGSSSWSFTGRLQRVNAASTALVAAVVVGVALARRRPRLAATTAAVVVGSLGTVEVLKHAVLRRPGLVPTDYARGHATFPSGHTTVGMVLAVVLVLVLPLRWRPWSWVGVGLFGATFGVSTVLSANHRPSDVVAGHLVVLAWTFAGSAALVRLRGCTDPADPPPTSAKVPLVLLLAVGVTTALGAAVMTAVVVLLDPSRVDVMRASFFVLAVLALTAEAAFVTAVLLVAYRAVSLDPVSPRSASSAAR